VASPIEVAVDGSLEFSVYVTSVAKNPEAASGYMGHEEFAGVGNSFMQRFPIDAEGDANTDPTGGSKQLPYHLAAGEAGWALTSCEVVSDR
jgi:hypothetical protein